MGQPHESVNIVDTAGARAALLSEVELTIGSASPEGVVTDPFGAGSVTTRIRTSNGMASYFMEHTPPSDTLCIVLQGHSGSFEDYGVGDLVRAVFATGADVLFSFMIGGTDTQSGTSSSHNASQDDIASHIQHDLESLNLVSGSYETIMATGISGGGWRTTLLAALDERIVNSVPIAGSLPLYATAALRDHEQHIDERGLSLSYLDLYVLGVDGGRAQTQVLFTEDTAFPASALGGDEYDELVAELAKVAGGAYSLQWVDQSVHEITPAALSVVMTALFGAPPPPSVDITIDDAGPGFSASPAGAPNTGGQSEWTRWDNGGVNGSYHAANNTEPREAVWDFGTLNGELTFSMGWHRHSNRATNATVEVLVDGSVVGAFNVNQRGSTGVAWTTIGTLQVDGYLTVRLSNPNADGQIIADAIRVVG